MVKEAKSSDMADVSVKANPSRKSAFSCEGCRKRKVGFLSLRPASRARVDSEAMFLADGQFVV